MCPNYPPHQSGLIGVMRMQNCSFQLPRMVQVYLQRMPALAGKSYGELMFHLPQATAYGLVQSRSRRCLLNPPAETIIDKLDEIVMIRATDLSEAEMQPLAEPVNVDMGASASVASAHPARLALLRTPDVHGQASGLQCRQHPSVLPVRDCECHFQHL